MLGSPIAVGVTPRGIAISADGSYAYVANRFSDSVSVINTSSNKVVKTVSVGRQPLGVAIAQPRPFSAMTVQYLVKLDPDASKASFKVTIPLTLDPSSDGIHPVSQSVFFRVGTFLARFPAGSFKLKATGSFVATRIINGVIISVTITPLGSNQFRAVLTGDINPKAVKLTLIIGNDGGNVLPDPSIAAAMAARMRLLGQSMEMR